jgi:hypothetical protein
VPEVKWWHRRREFTFARSLADPSKPLPANAPSASGISRRGSLSSTTGRSTPYLTQRAVVADVQAMAASAWLPGSLRFSGLGAHNVFAVLLAGVGDLDAAAKHVHHPAARAAVAGTYLVRQGSLLAELRERAAKAARVLWLRPRR